MKRIVQRAGFDPWPRIFHNLRASCERDWADRFPMPVVCQWTGHDADTAQRYYLRTVSEEHYEAASGGAELVHDGAELVQKCDADSCSPMQETVTDQGVMQNRREGLSSPLVRGGIAPATDDVSGRHAPVTPPDQRSSP